MLAEEEKERHFWGVGGWPLWIDLPLQTDTYSPIMIGPCSFASHHVVLFRSHTHTHTPSHARGIRTCSGRKAKWISIDRARDVGGDGERGV
jgi:hypothetical protein